MPERLIVLLTDEAVPEVLAELEGVEVRSQWQITTEQGWIETNFVVDLSQSEAVIDALDERFGDDEDYRLLLLDVQASLPRYEEHEEDEEEDSGDDGGNEAHPDRISREELYQDLSDAARPTRRYALLVTIAALVAGFGMQRNDVAVVIGAMVIAPLLGPNVAFALAATLADAKLARRAALSGALGTALAYAIALVIGWFGAPSLAVPEIAARTEVGIASLALALAAGVAGALSFTGGLPAGVIGVMVAVALLPPLVASGMLLAAGTTGPSVGAALLFAVNLISVNLAAIATFAVQGVSPRDFREERNGRRAVLLAVGVWLVLLGALVILILLRGSEAAN